MNHDRHIADVETLYNVYVDTLQDLIESAVQGDTRRVPLLVTQLVEMRDYAERELDLPTRSITAMKKAYGFTRQAVRELVNLRIDILDE